MLLLEAPGMHLARSLSCGQAFRWQQQGATWRGVVGDRCATVQQREDLLELNRPEEERLFWTRYFSLDKDYRELERKIDGNPALRECLASSAGIRVFRQEPFETIISFIVSANNNVKRISGILENLAQQFGEKMTDYGGESYFAFPRPAALAAAPLEELKAAGTGYRAAYIQGASQMIAEGFDLDGLHGLPSEAADKALQTLPGVGPKVAACILLFALGCESACPLDVWMKRALRRIYSGLDEKEAAAALEAEFGSWTGTTQQYLFHHARMCETAFMEA